MKHLFECDVNKGDVTLKVDSEFYQGAMLALAIKGNGGESVVILNRADVENLINMLERAMGKE